METNIHERDGVRIDATRSSIQVFPAIRHVKDSKSLYLKFSNNHVRTLAAQKHSELLLDFDFCLIDRIQNDTVVQLLAIITLTRNKMPVNEWKYVTMGVEYARTLLVNAASEQQWKDTKGNLIQVPPFVLNPESIEFDF